MIVVEMYGYEETCEVLVSAFIGGMLYFGRLWCSGLKIRWDLGHHPLKTTLTKSYSVFLPPNKTYLSACSRIAQVVWPGVTVG